MNSIAHQLKSQFHGRSSNELLQFARLHDQCTGTDIDHETSQHLVSFSDESQLIFTTRGDVKINAPQSIPMPHIMVDLETLDRKPGGVIVTIGAVAFDLESGELGPRLYININPASAEAAGLKVDTGTVMWWMRQSKEAQQALISEKALSLESALNLFTDFVKEIRNGNEKGEMNLWGNGAMFDNAFLERAYDAAGLAYPWQYWEHRDVRTLVQLAKECGFDVKKETKMEGTAHNALDDAIHQVNYCSKAWRTILGRVPAKN